MKRAHLLLFHSLLFLFTGMIYAQKPVAGSAAAEGNQFLLISGNGYSNQVSPDGRYIAGVKGLRGYLYDTESKTATDLGNDTEAAGVNSDGVACGVFRDPDLTTTGGEPLRVAGIYRSGAWTSLGIGSLDINLLKDPFEGSEANDLSDNGKIAAGCLNTNAKVIPCTWTLQDNGTWVCTEYAYPVEGERAQGAKILAFSGDGAVAGGWAVQTQGGPRLPVLWTSPANYKLLSEDLAMMGVSCISHNGAYAGFSKENRAVLYYVNEDRNEIVPGHTGAKKVEITAISDNGFVLGYSELSDAAGGSWRYGFVYSQAMGFVDLSDFIRIFAPDVQLPSNIKFQDKFLTVPMDISADGRVLTGWHGSGAGDRISWVLKLAEVPQVFKRPRNLRASVTAENRVRLSWEAPETSTATLTGYRIHRNNEPLGVTVAPDVPAYEDAGMPLGVHTYTVSAVYAQGESANSNDAYAIIADSDAIPFLEDFDSGSLASNYWHYDGWLVNQLMGRGIYGYGVTSAANVSTSAVKTLTSKRLDATALEKVYLNFVMGYLIEASEWGNDTLDIEVLSDDAGWKSVKKYVPEATFNPWSNESVDLSAAVAGKFFQFRFCSYGKNPNSSTVWDLDNVRIDRVPARDTQAPSALRGSFADGKADITWKTPGKTYELTYLKNNEVGVIGNGGDPFIAAIAFGPSELSLYQGKYLTSVSAFINQNYPAEALEIGLVVFRNGQKTVNQPIRSFVSTAGAWNTFPLETPLLIDGSIDDLKIGIEVIKHAAEEQPLGTDHSQWPSMDGNLYSEDGGKTWIKLADNSVNSILDNLAITGNLTDAANTNIVPQKDEDLLGYFIYRNDQNQGFTPSARYTDNRSSADACYTISAYYKDGLATLPSNPLCIKNLGIDPVPAARALVFPNPASDYIRISGPFTKASLLDVSGKKVLETTRNPLPVAQLAGGVYLLVIESGPQVTTCKVVKK
jgi:hypothetical protein